MSKRPKRGSAKGKTTARAKIKGVRVGTKRVLPEGVQYTVRNISFKADRALRQKAAERKTSLNEVLRQALLREAGVDGLEKAVFHDLDHLAGKWVDDPVFDEAINALDQIDESLWK
jgi:hypothetical protein